MRTDRQSRHGEGRLAVAVQRGSGRWIAIEHEGHLAGGYTGRRERGSNRRREREGLAKDGRIDGRYQARGRTGPVHLLNGRQRGAAGRVIGVAAIRHADGVCAPAQRGNREGGVAGGIHRDGRLHGGVHGEGHLTRGDAGARTIG